jgi:hypothetical protein
MLHARSASLAALGGDGSRQGRVQQVMAFAHKLSAASRESCVRLDQAAGEQGQVLYARPISYAAALAYPALLRARARIRARRARPYRWAIMGLVVAAVAVRLMRVCTFL